MAFRALPRPQFASLQSATFPIYFSLQSGLPLILALTASKNGQLSSPSDLLAPENRSTLIPLATTMVTGLLNMFVLRPITMKVMQDRRHQGMLIVCLLLQRTCFIFDHDKQSKLTWIETRDGKKSYDPAPHSKEMMALNKKFRRVHGLSSLVNIVSLLATVYYGVVLGKRLS